MTPPRQTHPNWKVDPVLKHAMEVCKEVMHMGKYISIDEQTIGFQGRHADKIRVTYKNAGDGFQADAICADGYTFNWYFRNQPAPQHFLNKGFSPLSSRVLCLLSQLPNKNYVCGMDNLYMSTKLSHACYTSAQKVMTHGVTRCNGRGLPKCITQQEVTRKEDLQRQRGTLKVAQLVNDPACDGFLALSLYDQKPVYLLTNACNNVEWIKKERSCWHKEKGKKVNVPYYRLNVIDMYNHNMNNVDIADQLRTVYRFFVWLRKRKWWWAMFFWSFEMLLTNAYVVYLKFQILHRHQPISHYEFHRQVALAWLKPDEYWGKKSEKKQRRSPRSHSSSSTESIVSTSIGARRSLYIQSEEKKETRCHRVTDASLHPFTGKLKDRLNISKMHLPIEATKSDSRCQLHHWAAKMRFRSSIVCATCNVTLCIKCFAHFHLVHDLVKSKAMIKKEICSEVKNLNNGGQV